MKKYHKGKSGSLMYVGDDSTLYSRSGFLEYGNLEDLTLLVAVWDFKIPYIDLQREM